MVKSKIFHLKKGHHNFLIIAKKISLILPFKKVSNTATLAYFAHFEDELIISITLDNLNCPRQHEFLATAVVKQHKQRTQCSSVGMKYLKKK